ncbi:hypothetical protein [Cupriavidus sp. TMH.W2]|uniref:hypothetical protein n=1 Tax=Cupriavidus sp. TMH.W2 TaxID=3434465 RepID=UPI003D77A3A9
MELHSASPAAYAYFDRIEAFAQDQAEAMFEAAAAERLGELPHSTASQPAEPDVWSELTPARPSVDWAYLTIIGVSFLMAGGVAIAFALALPTSGAAAISISTIAGCSLAVAWPSPVLETEKSKCPSPSTSPRSLG